MIYQFGTPGAGEPSDVSFDGMRYELTNDDWESQAARQEDDRWQVLRDTAVRVSRTVKRQRH